MASYNSIPDTNVRQGLITAFTPSISAPIYDMELPKDEDVPDLYILMTTQTNSQADTSKCGHNWWHTILLDVVHVQDQGYSDRAPLDALCNQINLVVDNISDVAIPGFAVYNTQVMNTHDMSLTTQTKTINRKLIRYQFLLGPNSGNRIFTSQFTSQFS